MFKKDEKINDFNEAETIIGESVQVKGHFENNGNVVINGSLDGEIKTKGAILVGEKAKSPPIFRPKNGGQRKY